MKANREQLLKTLTIASVGLTKREILEQSSDFVFTEDHLVTFNGEIFTKVATPLKGIMGAVPAEEFRKLLTKFPDPEIDLMITKSELRIKGKRRRAGITLQVDIHLPYKDVPTPKVWKPAPEKLGGVLLQASRCCGKNETLPSTTVVHITPNAVEACDNYQMFHYSIKTGFSKEIMVPAASLDALGGLSFKKICYRYGYLHFKLEDGHMISVRCMTGIYPDLIPFLKVPKPKKITLPSNLEDILSRAEVMQETAFDASVSVSIENGQIELMSRKEKGWYKESKKIDYTGSPLHFSVHPKMLEEIFNKKRTVMLGGNRMKIKVKEATFVICLAVHE